MSIQGRFTIYLEADGVSDPAEGERVLRTQLRALGKADVVQLADLDLNVRDWESCPDCSALPGQAHTPGCDVERCTACGGQRMLCSCRDHQPALAAWTGQWPGLAESLRRGWWCRRVHDPSRPAGFRYEPCDPATPGAELDLNRFASLRRTGADLRSVDGPDDEVAREQKQRVAVAVGERLAKVISHYVGDRTGDAVECLRGLALEVADELGASDARFDRASFLAACGLA